MNFKKKRRVLFFPWGVGGGAAYTGHCLVFANQLRTLGFEVAFSDGGVSSLIRSCGFTVLEQNITKQALPENVAPYLPFTSLERVYSVAARFYRLSRLTEQYNEDVRIIESWKPDVIVVDMVATAAMAARIRSIPVISIAEADFLSRDVNSWMPWFNGDPLDILPYPSCLTTFNQLAAKVGHPEIFYIPDLLWGDATLVPSISELDPVDQLEGRRGKISFAGPMFWGTPHVSTASPMMPVRESGQQKNVYISLGSGGMGTENDLAALLAGCSNPEWNSCVSLGLRTAPVALPHNMKSNTGITGLQIPLEWADLVVSHGGSGTVLASLLYGKPLVIVPFMSECEMNGRQYVENTGCGVVVRYSEFNLESRKIRFRSRYSKNQKENKNENEISEQCVARAVEEVLSQESFFTSARNMSLKLSRAKEAFNPEDFMKDLF